MRDSARNEASIWAGWWKRGVMACLSIWKGRLSRVMGSSSMPAIPRRRRKAAECIKSEMRHPNSEMAARG